MMDSLYIAWKYVSFNKLKTATLVACITLIAFLPLALQLLLEESERQLLSRAAATPLLIGAKGSALDLLMNSLYFGDEVPEPVTMAAADRIWDSNLASPIPLYVRFRARGYPIVGTTIEYFDFRSLHLSQGRLFTVLGECVVGATVAERFGLQPGDSVLSSPENLFDLAGVYPLKMHVVGVLARSHSPDDLAVFTDLKTTWVIEGLGHGHADLTHTTDASVILNRTPTTITANAKLRHYTEITPANFDTFHFHGELTGYPITAVIAVPPDTKAATLLRGRYLAQTEQQQILKPDEVIDGLLQNIFRITQVLDAVIVVVGLATGLAIVLVFALSLRLRQKEIDTIFKLGCRRLTIARLLTAVVFPAPEDEDPAFWVPNPATITAYQQADLILLNGASYAKWLNKVSLPRSRLVNTSAGFSNRYIQLADVVTHSHGPEGAHTHHGTAFTTWLDFELAGQQAKAIAEALGRQRPAQKATFQTNLEALEKDLLALDQQLRELVGLKPNQRFIASHPVYQYLARRYGLQLKSVHWEPDETPSQEQWAELTTLLKNYPAQWMIWEAEPQPAVVTQVESLGIKSVVFRPAGKRPGSGDFLSVMQDNVKNLGVAFQLLDTVSHRLGGWEPIDQK